MRMPTLYRNKKTGHFGIDKWGVYDIVKTLTDGGWPEEEALWHVTEWSLRIGLEDKDEALA